ncbi:conserved Plasmodium membrane protein, unknown function [Plasmodium reichenowi]|uniref:Transporter n=1 Tax=Plasmodium reichenowi TaxID=5854 RepID=A0A2P9DI17_PLARE|nr:conserved Plasmodium membrane protein, unknown function [Plasmodium reichenowi]
MSEYKVSSIYFSRSNKLLILMCVIFFSCSTHIFKNVFPFLFMLTGIATQHGNMNVYVKKNSWCDISSKLDRNTEHEQYIQKEDKEKKIIINTNTDGNKNINYDHPYNMMNLCYDELYNNGDENNEKHLLNLEHEHFIKNEFTTCKICHNYIKNNNNNNNVYNNNNNNVYNNTYNNIYTDSYNNTCDNYYNNRYNNKRDHTGKGKYIDNNIFYYNKIHNKQNESVINKESISLYNNILSLIYFSSLITYIFIFFFDLSKKNYIINIFYITNLISHCIIFFILNDMQIFNSHLIQSIPNYIFVDDHKKKFSPFSQPYLNSHNNLSIQNIFNGIASQNGYIHDILYMDKKKKKKKMGLNNSTNERNNLKNKLDDLKNISILYNMDVYKSLFIFFIYPNNNIFFNPYLINMNWNIMSNISNDILYNKYEKSKDLYNNNNNYVIQSRIKEKNNVLDFLFLKRNKNIYYKKYLLVLYFFIMISSICSCYIKIYQKRILYCVFYINVGVITSFLILMNSLFKLFAHSLNYIVTNKNNLVNISDYIVLFLLIDLFGLFIIFFFSYKWYYQRNVWTHLHKIFYNHKYIAFYFNNTYYIYTVDRNVDNILVSMDIYCDPNVNITFSEYTNLEKSIFYEYFILNRFRKNKLKIFEIHQDKIQELTTTYKEKEKRKKNYEMKIPYRDKKCKNVEDIQSCHINNNLDINAGCYKSLRDDLNECDTPSEEKQGNFYSRKPNHSYTMKPYKICIGTLNNIITQSNIPVNNTNQNINGSPINTSTTTTNNNYNINNNNNNNQKNHHNQNINYPNPQNERINYPYTNEFIRDHHEYVNNIVLTPKQQIIDNTILKNKQNDEDINKKKLTTHLQKNLLKENLIITDEYFINTDTNQYMNNAQNQNNISLPKEIYLDRSEECKPKNIWNIQNESQNVLSIPNFDEQDNQRQNEQAEIICPNDGNYYLHNEEYNQEMYHNNVHYKNGHMDNSLNPHTNYYINNHINYDTSYHINHHNNNFKIFRNLKKLMSSFTFVFFFFIFIYAFLLSIIHIFINYFFYIYLYVFNINIYVSNVYTIIMTGVSLIAIPFSGYIIDNIGAFLSLLLCSSLFILITISGSIYCYKFNLNSEVLAFLFFNLIGISQSIIPTVIISQIPTHLCVKNNEHITSAFAIFEVVSMIIISLNNYIFGSFMVKEEYLMGLYVLFFFILLVIALISLLIISIYIKRKRYIHMYKNTNDYNLAQPLL